MASDPHYTPHPLLVCVTTPVPWGYRGGGANTGIVWLMLAIEGRSYERETAHQAGEPAKWSVTNLHLPSAHRGKGKIRNSTASNSPLLLPFRAN